MKDPQILTGLVYEIVWARMLILVFGSTLFATTIILATFMAGFAPIPHDLA